jgi:hypothetical protein
MPRSTRETQLPQSGVGSIRAAVFIRLIPVYFPLPRG